MLDICDIAGKHYAKEELEQHAETAHANCLEFLQDMPADELPGFFQKVVGLKYDEMNYAEVAAALTLARAEAIRVVAEMAAI